MTHDQIIELIQYNYWARDRVLDAVQPLTAEQYARPMGNSFTAIRDTLVHIYAAEFVWNMRWTGISPTSLITAEQYPDLDGLVAAWSELEHQIRTFVAHAGADPRGLDHEIEYTLMDGTPGRASLRQMVQHVANHGSYHRGQITTMLRQLGATPPSSLDLITFFREQGSMVRTDL
jgi:uncharacterized damage-inducible protein DinB